jgi:CRISPR-associated Cas5-like protein
MAEYGAGPGAKGHRPSLPIPLPTTLV